MSVRTDLERGFSDPVTSAQSTFRAVLDAMARPGVAPQLAVDAGTPPGLAPATAALALTLFDHDTPIWRDAALNSDAIAHWLRFHTGAPLTGDPMRAAFALIGDPANMPALASFSAGTADYPDRSTTLILQVDSLFEGVPLTLRGPGIKTTATLAPTPLPQDFITALQANRALFPRGVDFMFCAADSIAALPRTTHLSVNMKET